MNLWFRLLKILPLGIFGKRVTWDALTQVFFRVWPADLDINLHMTNSRYLAMMDLARVKMMLRTGLWQWIRCKKMSPVTAGAMVCLRRPVAPFARVTLHTRFLGWDAKWMFIEHHMERRGELVCLAVVKAAFLGKHGPVLSGQIAGEFGHSGKQKPLPEWIAKWQAAEHAAAQAGEKL
jgi:acyl-CoA thioesterase FadM